MLYFAKFRNSELKAGNRLAFINSISSTDIRNIVIFNDYNILDSITKDKFYCLPQEEAYLYKATTNIANANVEVKNVDYYSSIKTYAVGDYCKDSNEKYYVCKTTITIGEAFNVAKWTQILGFNNKDIYSLDTELKKDDLFLVDNNRIYKVLTDYKPTAIDKTKFIKYDRSSIRRMEFKDTSDSISYKLNDLPIVYEGNFDLKNTQVREIQVVNGQLTDVTLIGED